MKLNRIYLKLLILFFFLISLLYLQKSVNALCGDADCQCDGPGEYCCQYDEMCCTGGGCPTYMCSKAGYAPMICFGEWTCCLNANPACTTCSQGFWGGGTCAWCPGGGDDDGGPSCSGSPSSPVPMNPADGDTFIDPMGSFTFIWTHDGNWGPDCPAGTFRVQIDTENTFTAPLFTESANLSSGTFTWDYNFCYEGTFYWRVGAANELGNYSWSPTRSLNVTFREPTATYTVPTDGAIWWTNPASPTYIEATALDSSAALSGHNLNRIQFHRRKDDNLDGTFGDSGWVEITSGNPSPAPVSCNDSSPCSIGPPPWSVYYKYWNPAHIDEGYYQLTVNAISNEFPACDTPIGKCTGNPNVGPTWSDCNAGGADESKVCVIRPPTAVMNSPANNAVLYPNVQADISATATDLGNNLSFIALRIAEDNLDGTYTDIGQLGATQPCAGGGCPIIRPWTPAPSDAGKWFIAYIRARDTMGAAGKCDAWCPGCISACSGHPLGQAGYLDCGADDYRRFRVCGSPPSAPSLVSPAVPNNENIPHEDVILTWNPPASWGDVCSVDNKRYTVYLKTLPSKNPAIDCSIYPDADFGPVPGCELISATNCDVNVYTPDTGYCWLVKANNGEYWSPASQKWYFDTENPLVHHNWTTSVGGPTYAQSMNQGFPENGVGDWILPYVVYKRNTTADVSLISTLEVNIAQPNHGDDVEDLYSESVLWAEGVGFDPNYSWPKSPAYEGTPPSGETIALPQAGGCSEIFTSSGYKILPNQAYKIEDPSCAEAAINAATNTNGYNMAQAGTSVVYLLGSGEIEIRNKFTTQNTQYHMVFVTGPDVSIKIPRDFTGSELNPSFASNSAIMASFVVTGDGGITYEGTDNIWNDPDTSIVVDGPVIAKSISLERNRGENNTYPSEIFKYSPAYIYDLTRAERTSTDGANKTGLFTTDITWTEVN